MGRDKAEGIRRGQTTRKTSTTHPYAAIEHRVIDSPAYADLNFSAAALLLLIARQLTKDNNGRLQAAFSYVGGKGFKSEHTLSRAIAELIAHGFIYRTRSGGYQNGASQYAVTWLPIKQPAGLYLDGFLPCAWRAWQPEEKKTPPAKVQDTHGKKGICAQDTPPKSAGGCPPKSADTELIPCTHTEAAAGEAQQQDSSAAAQHHSSTKAAAHHNSPGTALSST